MTFVLFILRRAHARLNMSNLKKKKDSLVILVLQILKTPETAEKNIKYSKHLSFQIYGRTLTDVAMNYYSSVVIHINLCHLLALCRCKFCNI